MPHALDSCLRKIERAKEHRNTLQQHVSETFAIKSNCPRLGIKLDPQTGEHVMFINYMPDLVDFLTRCEIIAGEMVYGLHSALNHLSYQLVLLNTGGIPKHPTRIQFPIADTRDGFEKLKKRDLMEVAPDHIAIMERYQGYHRIDQEHSVGLYFHPLSVLRDLVSTDKHRVPIQLMIPTTGVELPDMKMLAFTMACTMQQIVRCQPVEARPVEFNTEVMRAKLPAGTIESEIEKAGYISPAISLDEGRHFIAAFDKIAAVVLKIVREFEPFF